MKRQNISGGLIWILSFVFATITAFAQKPPLDAVAFKNWASVGDARLSNDGKYMAYSIFNEPPIGRTLVLQKAESTWKREYPGAVSIGFTDNSRWLILINEKAVLHIVSLNNTLSAFLLDTVTQCQLLTTNRLIYRSGQNRSLFILDLSSYPFLTDTLPDVQFNGYNKPGTVLLYQTSKDLHWRNLYSKNDSIIVPNPQSNPIQFNRSCTSIFFYKEQPPLPKPNQDTANIHIWRYTDTYLQTPPRPRNYLYALNLADHSTHRLQQDNEHLEEQQALDEANNYILMSTSSGADCWWQKKARSSVYLVSTHDGTHTLIKEDIPYGHDFAATLNFHLSPGEKYALYYDPLKRSYFSYEISTNTTRNITKGIPTSWKDETYGNKYADPVAYPIGIAAWLPDDKAVWIYDNNDLWQLDPQGTRKPINLTHGYGHTHHIKFRLISTETAKIITTPYIILSAFNTQTKDNGFYRLIPGKDPKRLSMTPHLYYAPDLVRQGAAPIKARDTNTWIVQRQSATEAPNFYITHDLKTFTPITHIAPQKDYNWLTAEFIHWKATDGAPATGILYKPQNFDPHKKYPVIFNYYEERSNELHEYKTPGFTNDNINIPYFVSRGYLVCIPDIGYRLGHLAESVANHVASAAKYLQTKPWVDGKHMGLQGHSFGGAETNALLTKTHLFAAAAEGAGVADLVSSYLGLSGGGNSRIQGYELGQGRMRASLWQRKDLYLKNNPILNADKITTPLLMMHNKRDGAVPWSQGVELFLALRRLNRKVWLLQYDNGDHFVEGRDAEDYTTRLTQFFDHFLRNAPKPQWMTGDDKP